MGLMSQSKPYELAPSSMGGESSVKIPIRNQSEVELVSLLDDPSPFLSAVRKEKSPLAS